LGDGCERSDMTPNASPQDLALILGLSFFFGLAYEEFYAQRALHRPGGVRTFPLLALLGAGLYLIEPAHAVVFTAGLLVLGAWLHAWYRSRVQVESPDAAADSSPPAEAEAAPTGTAGLMGPVCNLLAYVIGPIVLLEPSWVAVSLTVGAVLLLGAREPLHELARRIPFDEIATFGKFLVLAGIVLPLLPDVPVTRLTAITPHQLWLAVVVVSSLSYGSYLVQRYVSPARGVLLAAVLGGLYSSTATTVVLARRVREDPGALRDIRAGIVLATALMYFRIELVIAAFNLVLARAFAPALLSLAVLGVVLAAGCYRLGNRGQSTGIAFALPKNPLELSAALIFAALFVVVSLASAWAQTRFGQAGVYALAAIVGVTDIDPFVLSLAQGGLHGVPSTVMMVAILIAVASNNLLKAAYAAGFAGIRASLPPLATLVLLAMATLGVAAWLAGGLG
jgi:uncharacterized membrane protein (DUF4010 family)